MLPSPILTNEDLAKILYIHEEGGVDGFTPFAVDGLYPVAAGGEGMRNALEDVRNLVSAAIDKGANVIVLSDRHSNAEYAPIPSLLLTSAVHHHLIREKTRTRVALVVETGDAREVHHMALLIGYGAAAINPYLAFETIEDMIANGELIGITPTKAIYNYIKSCSKGVLKVMSKMGISTVASYTGAQVFEAVGLGQAFVDEYFTGTTSKLGGVGLDEIAAGSRAAPPLRPLRPLERAGRTATCGSAASTSGAAKASTTCSTPTRSSSCSTRRAPVVTRSSSSTARPSTAKPNGSPLCAVCSRSKRGCARRSRSTKCNRCRKS